MNENVSNANETPDYTDVGDMNDITPEEAEETAGKAEEKPKREKTPMVILDAQHFMEEVGKLVGQVPEGKTLEGFYNYFYSAMKAKFLESMGKRTNGCICGSDRDVVEWVQKYFSDDVKEGETVPEPKFDKVAVRKPSAPKPKKTPTPDEIAKKAAADAEKAKRKAEKEKKAALKKAWEQQSFDFFSRYGV